MKSRVYPVITIILVIIIAAATWYEATAFQKLPTYNFVAVGDGNVTQGVVTTGTVVAAQDISLAFQTAGTVASLNATVGQAVKAGDVVAELDNKNADAAEDQAEAAVETAQANYQKVIDGATSDQIAVTQTQVQTASTTLANAQINLTNTQNQQAVLVENAYRTLLNSTPAAIPGGSNTDGVTAAISGTYNNDQEGSYTISLFQTGSGLQFQYSGLESGSGLVKTTPQPLGSRGLYITFSSTSPTMNDTWTVTIPNTQAATYVTNYNAYQTALQTQTTTNAAAQTQVDAAQNALAQAQANLTLQQSAAQPEDIAAAKAAVDSAEAQLQAARNTYSNGVITAPTDGTITTVNTKIGESAAPDQPVITMISSGTYQINTYVTEAQLGRIKIGDTAQVTLDAYGDAVDFPASVITIDPAATQQNGVDAYLVTLQFEESDNRIQEGMGANITIADQQHSNVVEVPQNDVFTDGNTQFVLVNAGGGTIKTQTVTTGLQGVDGSVEITSGLSAGDQIADFTK